MKIFNQLDEIKNIEKTVIALGNFDGIHKGHQELIRRAIKSSEVAGMKSAVFTFSNHPRNLLKKDEMVKNILYWDEKVKIIEDMGVDYLFSIPFTDEVGQMSPEAFAQDLLIGRLNMGEAYCGFNYRFGHKAKGDVALLMKESIKHNVGIHVLEPYMVNGNVVSSTLIRQMIEEGKVDQCEKYLGRPCSIAGEVVVGNRLGKSIGFPTSNLIIDESMVSPSNGVYITYCTYNGVKYPSITNVGKKPTIGDFEKNVETHIFDFDKELYGKNIRVEFLKKSRDEEKFDSVEKLSKAIMQDCIRAKAYHQSMGR